MISFSKTNGKYGCFSNFYPCKVEYDGLTFLNNEAAWQAQKCARETTKKNFTIKDAKSAKASGRRVKLRPDWEDVKYQLMIDTCYAKFSQNEKLKEILLSTGDEELEENTTGWHDNIWGNCYCPKCKDITGKNLLGKALMEVRTKFYNE
jgi:hypothetical protein